MADVPTFRSPFDGLTAAAANAGIRVRDRSDLGVAAIMVSEGRRADLAQTIATELGVILPHGAWLTIGETLSLVGVGPGADLALKERPHLGWAEDLARTLGDCASVTDLSGAYGILRLSGPAILPLMAKGPFIDFETFKVHEAAVSLIGHVGVTLWRLDEQTFEIASPRSYAQDLWHWLDSSAAEFGLAWQDEEQTP